MKETAKPETNSNIRTDLRIDYVMRKASLERSPGFVIDADGKAELAPSGKSRAECHVIYAPDGSIEWLPTLFLRNQAVEEGSKDTKTAAQALLAYYRWMHDEGRAFNDFYADPRDGVLWGFRSAMLENVRSIDTDGAEHGSFEISTIKTYLSQLVMYYAWLINAGYLEVSSTFRPFQYRWRQLKRKKSADMLAHIHQNKVIDVKQSDILKSLPRVQKLDPSQRLNPLTPRDLEIFEREIKKLGQGRELLWRLCFECGLRINEARTFSTSHVRMPSNRYEIECTISPVRDGCETKFEKERTIKVAPELMSRLFEYLHSDERLDRLGKGNYDEDIDKKTHPKHRPRLFISNRGTAYALSTLSELFAKIRRQIQKTHPEWNHTPHDLRATYATRRLYLKSKEQGRPFRYVAHELMSVMGHDDFDTTEKYVLYWEDKEISRGHAEELNLIADEARAR